MVVKAVKRLDLCVETQLKCLTDCCSISICIFFLFFFGPNQEMTVCPEIAREL